VISLPRVRFDTSDRPPFAHDAEITLRYDRYQDQLDERHGRSVTRIEKLEPVQIGQESERLTAVTWPPLRQDVDQIKRLKQINAAQQDADPGDRQNQRKRDLTEHRPTVRSVEPGRLD